MKKLGVYVHIPFCLSRCAYCDFISSTCLDDAKISSYVEHIVKEIDLLRKKGLFENYEIDTIYFGGGTPSLLKTHYFRSILEILSLNRRAVSQELTIEANPATIDEKALIELKEMGINRISIGVQSLNDTTLKAINRRHTAKEALDAIALAEKTKLSISVDLMIGVPYQTKDDIKKFVDEVTKYDVKHISIYMLSLEEGTPLKAQVDKGLIKVLDDDEKVDHFNYAAKLLEEKGFVRYEVSNFAIPGFEAKHNKKYWNRDDYIGLGLGAHSLIDNKRFYNPDNFEDYFKALDLNKLAHIKEADLDQNDIKEEYIMLAFRTNEGIILDDYLQKFGQNFLTEKQKAVHLHKNELNITDKNVSIKEEYLNVLNQIVIDFI